MIMIMIITMVLMSLQSECETSMILCSISDYDHDHDHNNGTNEPAERVRDEYDLMLHQRRREKRHHKVRTQRIEQRREPELEEWQLV